MIKYLTDRLARESVVGFLQKETDCDQLPYFHLFLPDLNLRIDCSLDMEENTVLTIFGDYPYLELSYLANVFIDLAPSDWNIKFYNINGKLNNYIPLSPYEQTK